MRAHLMPSLLTCLALAACGSTGDIAYVATVPIVTATAPAIAAVTVKDIRDEKPNRLATVRGGYGNPAYVFDTSKPVSDEVASIFTKALQARNLLGPASPYRMQVTLRTFYGDKYLTRRSFIDMDLTVLDATGAAVYKDTGKYDISGEFHLFDGDIDPLVLQTQTLLDTTIDRMLDKPEFRRVLASPVPQPRQT